MLLNIISDLNITWAHGPQLLAFRIYILVADEERTRIQEDNDIFPL